MRDVCHYICSEIELCGFLTQTTPIIICYDGMTLIERRDTEGANEYEANRHLYDLNNWNIPIYSKFQVEARKLTKRYLLLILRFDSLLILWSNTYKSRNIKSLNAMENAKPVDNQNEYFKVHISRDHALY